MIRNIIERQFTNDLKYIEAAGLSTDTKPTTGVITGSRFTEVDTGILCIFDESTGAWTAQNSGNGKTSIAGAVVTLGTSLKYTGSQQTQGVASVVLGETTLTENTDYTVKDNKATEVGSYTLHIVGKGSYTGVIGKAFTVSQGDGSVSASPDTLTLTEGGEAGASTLTVTGDGTVSVESSAEAVATVELDGTTVTVTPVAEGSATVTVTLAAGDNYTGGTDTISITVEAAEAQDG